MVYVGITAPDYINVY